MWYSHLEKMFSCSHHFTSLCSLPTNQCMCDLQALDNIYLVHIKWSKNFFVFWGSEAIQMDRHTQQPWRLRATEIGLSQPPAAKSGCLSRVPMGAVSYTASLKVSWFVVASWASWWMKNCGSLLSSGSCWVSLKSVHHKIYIPQVTCCGWSCQRC